MPREPRIETGQDAGADLRAALGRLRRGHPAHPDHVKARREGRLRISVAAVAKEANRSRTLIGGEGCAYPEIRREVLACAQAQEIAPRPAASRLDAQGAIAALRQENALLRQEKAVLATRLQDAVNVAHAHIQRAKDMSRRAARNGRNGRPDHIVGVVAAAPVAQLREDG
jgi:hypothetical protein